MPVILRPFQAEIVEQLRAAYSAGHNAPLLQLATGGGKTTIFCHICALAIERGSAVFLLAHRAELIKQISTTLARFGVYHRVIAPAAIVSQCEAEHRQAVGRSYVDQTARAVVASVQTLVRRLGSIDIIPALIIIDEAHHLTKKSTWGAIVANYRRAKLLLVSATPARLDGQGLGVKNDGFADVIIQGPQMDWLIDNGFLCNFRIFAPPANLDLRQVSKIGGDYQRDKLADILNRPTITGSAVNHYEALTPGQRAIIFTCNREHARDVAAEFNAAGIPAAILDGSLDAETRADRIAKFATGELKILSTVDVVSEGVDIPAIEVAILLRPTASLIFSLQSVGRILRPAPNKTIATIIDHVGNVARHGWPDEVRSWTLDGVKKNPVDLDAVNIKTCLKCFAIFKPAAVCPSCGEIPEIKSRDQLKNVSGVLVELTRQQKAIAKIEREQLAAIESARKKQEEKKAKTYDDFLALGISRCYQYPDAWARKRASFKKK